VAHERPDTVSLLGAAVEAAVDEGSPRPVPIKLQAIPPSLEHLVPLLPSFMCYAPLLFRNLLIPF
jgi:hypothetical protein